jgi:hypothetical protein
MSPALAVSADADVNTTQMESIVRNACLCITIDLGGEAQEIKPMLVPGVTAMALRILVFSIRNSGLTVDKYRVEDASTAKTTLLVTIANAARNTTIVQTVWKHVDHVTATPSDLAPSGATTLVNVPASLE